MATDLRRLAPALSMGLFGMVAICGCGGSEFSLASVSGRVTLNGEPLAGVHVTFQPKARPGTPNAGPSSYGMTDAQGRFSLKTMTADDSGAVVGHHVVRLTRQINQPQRNDQEPMPTLDRSLPKRCSDGSLTYEVGSGGTDQVNFELSAL